MADHEAPEGREHRPGAAGEVKPTQKIDPTSKQVLGRMIGGYRIQSELGRGGMAMVYRAHDDALDRTVAVKILPQNLLQEDEEFAQRFEREAKAAARLDHANVVQVYSAGRSEGIFYIAMQFIEGRPLSDLMHSRRVDMREALDLVRQAALGLDAAHRLGIVHRDVKPGNIMVDAEGRVKVMDFGLAKAHQAGSAITRTGTYLGTPEYSSPEQCETRDVDARSDLYSLGVVLYELLSGALPHFAETPLALFKKITEERPIPIEDLNRAVPKSVRALLERMLAKRPQDRVGSAAEVAASIERILKMEKLPSLPSPDGQSRDLPVISGRIPVGRRRQTRTAAGLAALTLAGAGALLGGMYFAQDQAPEGYEPQPKVTAAPPRNEPVLPHPVVLDQMVVFDFQNGDPKGADAREYQWLEVGITEMLVADLGQGGGLDVMLRDDLVHRMHELLHRKVAWPGGAEAAGAAGDDRVSLNEESRKLVAELRARWLLSGVFYAKDQLRIVAKLYRLGDDETLSAVAPLQASGAVANVFTVVDDLAAKVLDRMPHARRNQADSNWDGRTSMADPAGPAAADGPELERLCLAQSKGYVTDRFARRPQDAPKTLGFTGVGGGGGAVDDKANTHGAADPGVGGSDKPGMHGDSKEGDAPVTGVLAKKLDEDARGESEEEKAERTRKGEDLAKDAADPRRIVPRWREKLEKLRGRSAGLMDKLERRFAPAATGEDPLARYQTYCEARISLEEMTEQDPSATREQTRRLSEIFARGSSMAETLKQIGELLDQIESGNAPEPVPQPK